LDKVNGQTIKITQHTTIWAMLFDDDDDDDQMLLNETEDELQQQ
jgi:hypothetical protein